MSVGFLKIAAVLVSLTMLVVASGRLTVEHNNVVPFRSEISVGSYVNYSYNISDHIGNLTDYEYTFINLAIVSLNSTAFTFNDSERGAGGQIIGNVTINFTSRYLVFPYYNGSMLSDLEANGTCNVSHGTYMFDGVKVPVANATLLGPELLKYGLQITNETFIIDTHSGLVLNSTEDNILGGTLTSGGTQVTGQICQNTPVELMSTNIDMSNTSPFPIRFILVAAAVSVMAVALVAVFWMHRKRKM